MNPLLIEEMLSALGLMSEEATAAAEATGETTKGLNDLDKSTKKASDSLAKDFIQSLKQVAKTLNDLEDATIAGDRTATKYSNTLGTMGTSTMILNEAIKKNWSHMFKLGLASAFAGEKLNAWAISAVKQHDMLMKGYNSLSGFGAIDSNGLRGLLDSVKDVGATPETMEYLISAVTQASEEMSVFGGTVQLGSKRFTHMIDGLLDPSKDFERVLTNLGYSTEDIVSFSASFIATNSRTLKGMTKDEEALKLETNQYLETLTELAELTGVSRDQQRKAAEELQLEVQWRQYLRELAKQPNGAKKVQEANELMALSLRKNGKEVTMSMVDLALHGAATRQATAQMQGAIGPAAKTFSEALRSGADATVTADKMNKQLAVGVGGYLDTFGRAGSMADDSAHSLFINSKLYDIANYSLEDNVKTVKEHTQQMKSEGDARLNEETKRRQAERAVTNYYQELYYEVGKYAIPALRLFSEELQQTAIKFGDKFNPLFTGSHELDRYNKAQELNKLVDEQKETAKKKSEVDQKILENNEKIAENGEKARNATGVWDKITSGFNQGSILYEKERLETERKKAEREAAIAKSKVDKVKDKETTRQSSVVKEGAPGTDQRLIELQKQFKQLYPDANITSTTGGEHVKGSKHKQGLAFDVNIGRGRPMSDDEVDKMSAKLKELGASYVKDERSKPFGEKEWTGPHLHVEIPKKPVDLNSKKTSMAAPNYDNTAQVAALNANQVGALNNSPTMVDNNKEVVAKLDNLERLFNRSLSVQQDILTHTKMAA